MLAAAVCDVKVNFNDIKAALEGLARRLGIVADELVKVKLADGSLREVGIGDARIEYSGSKRAVTVMIGLGDQEPLLGLTTLEALRLKVNPVTRELERFTPFVYVATT
jgi:predicted aspartyl protease